MQLTVPEQGWDAQDRPVFVHTLQSFTFRRHGVSVMASLMSTWHKLESPPQDWAVGKPVGLINFLINNWSGRVQSTVGGATPGLVVLSNCKKAN